MPNRICFEPCEVKAFVKKVLFLFLGKLKHLPKVILLSHAKFKPQLKKFDLRKLKQLPNGLCRNALPKVIFFASSKKLKLRSRKFKRKT